MAEQGIDTTVLTTDPTGQLPAVEQSDGVSIRRVPAWPRHRDYYFAPGVYREICNSNWDLVHCQGYQSLVAPVAMLASVRSAIPYVLTLHSGGQSTVARKALQRVQWRVLRPLIARAEQVVAVSNFEAEYFSRRLNLSRERIVVIPNGAGFSRSFRANLPSPDPTRIVSVGRLVRYKGHHRLIAAMPLILDRLPSAQLEIIGSGPYERALRQQVEDLGVQHRVVIRAIPASNRQEMARTVARAGLVVLLSQYEANPISAQEAIALGRPVLVAYAAGLADLADRGLANSISLWCTREELATAIVSNLLRPVLPPPITLPDWDQCVEHILELYWRILHCSP
jgi:glycosyltransferase involved in cell wall biosynthesis